MRVILLGWLAHLLTAASLLAADGPLKVFVLAGQSNMQGHAQIKTLDPLADNPVTAPLLQQIRHDDGSLRTCERVWISSVGSAGPRVFSDYIQTRWREQGLDVAQEMERYHREPNGVLYRHLIDHVWHVPHDMPRVVPTYEPKQGYELAGFVWFQGFHDLVDDWFFPEGMNPGGY